VEYTEGSLCRQVNGVDIVVTTDDARLSPYMIPDTLATPTDGAARRSYKSSVSDADSRMFGGSSSAMSYASSYDPDNVALRHPVYSGLVFIDKHCCLSVPTVWNSLPSFVRTADSFTSFRSQLKTVYQHQPSDWLRRLSVLHQSRDWMG